MIDLRALLTGIAVVLEGDPVLAGRLRSAIGAPADDELLTLRVAGKLVDKTGRAIRDAGRRGEVEVLVVGRSPRIRRSALMEWARPVEVAAPKTADTDAASAVERAARRWGSR